MHDLCLLRAVYEHTQGPLLLPHAVLIMLLDRNLMLYRCRLEEREWG